MKSEDHTVEGNWRMAMDCLPTRLRLTSKGVAIPINCRCTNEFENSWHPFYSCSYAQNVWKELVFCMLLTTWQQMLIILLIGFSSL